MIIALCGASGSGKTTLAHYLEKTENFNFTENSAGLIIPKEKQDELQQKYGWKKAGHKEVINLSNSNPEFGWEFQNAILDARTKLLEKYKNVDSFDRYLLDRSPIDNLTYFLLQCSHNQSDERVREFIEKCYQAIKMVDKVIFVRSVLDIEENGSRVKNQYYQRMADSVFAHVIDTYFTQTEYVEVVTDIFEDRCEQVTEFIFN